MRKMVVSSFVILLTMAGCHQPTATGGAGELAHKPGRAKTIVVIHDPNDHSTGPQDIVDALKHAGKDVADVPLSGVTVTQGAEIWHVDQDRLAGEVCGVVNGDSRYHGPIIRKIGGFRATNEPFVRPRYKIRVYLPAPGGPGPATGEPCRTVGDRTHFGGP